jgi:hypothetical protein
MASHWIMLIAQADQAEANSMTGQDSFTVGLSATGEEPATHYWAGYNDSYKDQVYAQLSTLGSFEMTEQDWDSPGYITRDAILASAGLETIPGGPPPR